MAQMIANYTASGASPGVETAAQASAIASPVTSGAPVEASAARDVSPAVNGSGYLNEVAARPATTTERSSPGDAPPGTVSDEPTPRQA
jgi:hypothetical protein